jgi:5-methylcytosine-specific restriction endonuclease McrA
MPNGNQRGSAEDRRRRKQWLLDTFGDGVEVMCHLEVSDQCLMVLTFETLTVDRVVPGCLGGRYTRDNIRPACGPCQDHQGGKLAHRPAPGNDLGSGVSAGKRLLRSIAT